MINLDLIVRDQNSVGEDISEIHQSLGNREVRSMSDKAFVDSA